MSRLGLVFATLCAVAASSVAGAATESRSATLRMLDASPVIIRGAGFKVRERVRVRATANERSRAKVVYASPAGTFTVAFTALSTPDPCTVEAFAIRSSGGRVVLKLVDRMCPPPLAP